MFLNHDPVRGHTPAPLLERIDEVRAISLERHAALPPEQITERLRQLDHEWDTDRVVEVQAAGLGLIGLAGLAGAGDRPMQPGFKAFVATTAAAAGLLSLCATGWQPLLRRCPARFALARDRERALCAQSCPVIRREPKAGAQVETGERPRRAQRAAPTPPPSARHGFGLSATCRQPPRASREHDPEVAARLASRTMPIAQLHQPPPAQIEASLAQLSAN